MDTLFIENLELENLENDLSTLLSRYGFIVREGSLSIETKPYYKSDNASAIIQPTSIHFDSILLYCKKCIDGTTNYEPVIKD